MKVVRSRRNASYSAGLVPGASAASRSADGRSCNSGDDVLLPKQVQNEDGQSGKDGLRHEVSSPSDCAKLVADHGDAIDVAHLEVWTPRSEATGIVPRVQEGEDAQRGLRRNRQQQDHAPEDLPAHYRQCRCFDIFRGWHSTASSDTRQRRGSLLGIDTIRVVQIESAEHAVQRNDDPCSGLASPARTRMSKVNCCRGTRCAQNHNQRAMRRSASGRLWLSRRSGCSSSWPRPPRCRGCRCSS